MISGRKHSNRFTLLPNAAVVDENLSFGALDLLGYLLSCPDYEILSKRHLQHRSGVGWHNVRGFLKEVESAGYVGAGVGVYIEIEPLP